MKPGGKRRMPKQIALSQNDPARAAARTAVSIDDDSQRTAVTAARAALEKKAENVVILDLRGISGYADFLVIGSGTSDRQLEAIADGVEKELSAQGHRAIGAEVVHVFHQEERSYYDLEGLWSDAPRVEP